MPITSIDTDLDNVSLTIVADFDAPLQRLWDAYADPRQIEKFWGPPGWPATFTRHDMAAEGHSYYEMNGPDGESSRGYWDFTHVEPPHWFEVIDGFLTPDGQPNTELPNMRMRFMFEATDSGSRLTTTTWFNSAEELEQLLEMGMREGTEAAMGQIDGVLADHDSFAATQPTQSQILDDTHIRVSRIIAGTVDEVWRAHHEPEVLRQWMLGPDGWSMPVCDVATQVGESYRNEWESNDGKQRFGFTGELLESRPPHREVTTERLIDQPEPSTRNEMTLVAIDGGTLLSLVITYPDPEIRDTILATGMTDGMEASYARLEREILNAHTR